VEGSLGSNLHGSELDQVFFVRSASDIGMPGWRLRWLDGKEQGTGLEELVFALLRVGCDVLVASIVEIVQVEIVRRCGITQAALVSDAPLFAARNSTPHACASRGGVVSLGTEHPTSSSQHRPSQVGPERRVTKVTGFVDLYRVI
jgi:hypothetical protein